MYNDFRGARLYNLKKKVKEITIFLSEDAGARLYICVLQSPAGKGLTAWLSFVVFNCKFVIFQLVSWVRCGT